MIAFYSQHGLGTAVVVTMLFFAGGLWLLGGAIHGGLKLIRKLLGR